MSPPTLQPPGELVDAERCHRGRRVGREPRWPHCPREKGVPHVCANEKDA